MLSRQENSLNRIEDAKTRQSQPQRSWIDNPPPTLKYHRHLNSPLVKKYLEWASLPLIPAQSVKELLVTGYAQKSILSVAPTIDPNVILIRFNIEKARASTDLPPIKQQLRDKIDEPTSTLHECLTLAVSLDPTLKNLDDIRTKDKHLSFYQEIFPLLELKLPPLELDADAPALVKFRFQVPSAGWSPIPGTAQLFPEIKIQDEEAIRKADPESKAHPTRKSRHALYKMDLPREMQADPFKDSKQLLPKDRHRPRRLGEWYQGMVLNRLEKKELDVAVAFRGKWSSMQHQAYFARFRFDEMRQWMIKCITEWGQQLGTQYEEKTKNIIQRKSETYALTYPILTNPHDDHIRALLKNIPTDADQLTANHRIKPTPGDKKVDTLVAVHNHWAKHREPDSIENISLAKDLEEFKKVADNLLAGLPTAEIKDIQRIQNGEAWDKFQLTLQGYCDGQPEYVSKTCIKWLFHGTTEDKVNNIMNQGFDPSLCRSLHPWGNVICFATQPDYSHHYSKPDKDNIRYVFLAQVLTGESTVERADLAYPSLKPRIRQEGVEPGIHDYYNSTIDRADTPMTFSVRDAAQTYPTYLIKYKYTVNILPSIEEVASVASPLASLTPSMTTGVRQGLNLLSSQSILSPQVAPESPRNKRQL